MLKHTPLDKFKRIKVESIVMWGSTPLCCVFQPANGWSVIHNPLTPQIVFPMNFSHSILAARSMPLKLSIHSYLIKPVPKPVPAAPDTI